MPGYPESHKKNIGRFELIVHRPGFIRWGRYCEVTDFVFPYIVIRYRRRTAAGRSCT